MSQLPKKSQRGPLRHGVIKRHDGNLIVWPARDENGHPLVMLGGHPDEPDYAIAMSPGDATMFAAMIKGCVDFVESDGNES